MTCNLRRIAYALRIWWLLLLSLTAASMSAQSLDPSSPTPVRNNQLLGKIAARDLGDARLTDHYYAFTGTPGDLLITVRSQNLNGDLDVFTAGSLRPLLKLTLYAESTSPVTKGIYLRKRENLILRVEARSPNDDEGIYQLFFGGSFEPIIGGPDIAEAENAAVAQTETTSSDPKVKRVSSAGARLPEPEPTVTEVAAAPTPEPTPEARPSESPSPITIEKSAETEVPKPTTPARAARSRRPTGRRTRTPAPVKAAETVAPTSGETRKEDQPEEAESKPKASTRSTPKRTSSARAVKTTPEPEPETGPRLVIETNDGTLINRSMSGVKRVTVENGQVVVTGKDGKIDRILLANVVRMSIAP